jgi:hypothetical protein
MTLGQCERNQKISRSWSAENPRRGGVTPSRAIPLANARRRPQGAPVPRRARRAQALTARRLAAVARADTPRCGASLFTRP